MTARVKGVLREPQNWINIIGVGAVLALSLGAFEPAERVADVQPAQDLQIASAQDVQAR